MIIKKDREHFKIHEGIFDVKTIKLLSSLANKRYFKTLDHPISTGKEADVYRATTKDGFIAVKMYRIETSKFVKTMHNYIDGDPRFEDYRHSKRGIIKVWCQKEFRNLRDAYDKGLPVPKPIKFEENIFLMEFLGEKGQAYPTLDKVKSANYKGAVEFMEKFVIDLWNNCQLVHADLSEFNVIFGKNKFFVIDMGQGLSVRHPRAREYLKKDIINIERYAKKNNIKFDVNETLEQCKKYGNY